MEYEWDEKKDAANRAKHGIGFGVVVDFDWGKSVIVNRSRHSDGEPRYAAIGLYGRKVHTVVFTRREGRIRIISFRRGNRIEERIYDQEKN